MLPTLAFNRESIPGLSELAALRPAFMTSSFNGVMHKLLASLSSGSALSWK
ncbi:Uncharacterised protein [Klebsiella pneumoniae]|nr:Uncharacterised protein [Klebsiella pneumoniae]